MKEGKGIRTAVIYGSVRVARKGIHTARFVVRKLEQRGHDVTLIDPVQHEFPMLDRMYKEFAAGEAPASMRQVAEVLHAADGFVIVSGEYNHSVPPALKNLLDHYQSEYLYKPSAIVTYSAGPFGGVRGLINLRAVLAELGTPSIPSAFPVSKAHSAFDEEGNALEPSYEQRIVKFLVEYEWYAHALKNARECDRQAEGLPTQQEICRGQLA